MDAVESVPSPTETPAAEPEDASIASHAASFDPNRPEPTADGSEPAPTTPERRHRARSQQARAEDVPRIKELTGKWRSEQERATRLETELAQLKQQPARGIDSIQSESKQAHMPASEKFPAFADWLDKNPNQEYEDYLDARFSHKQDSERAQQRVQQQQRQASEEQYALMSAHGARLQEFVKTHPDFGAKHQATIQAIGENIPPLLGESIVRDDNGPALLYAFYTDPVFRDDMILLSDGKPVTEASVALLRRRLNLQLSRSSAGTTGSAAAAPPQSWTARPPNPVRTGPVTTGDEPPGEGASISEHAKYFGPKRR
jgi:hypothetical protein